MLRFGPESGPVVVMALPLFEEANRVRAFTVTILRALAEHGIAGVLPDLPGMGESLVDAADIGLRDWQEAFAAAVEGAGKSGHVHGAAIRSGALLDLQAALASRWCFAAQDARRMVREWQRTVGAAARETNVASVSLDAMGLSDFVDIAGHRVPGRLLAELAGPLTEDRANSAKRRDVRLEDDPGPSDARIPGAPLWRRAEPGNDVVLAHALADDIAQWVRTCDAC